jgi:hypothetical protein
MQFDCIRVQSSTSFPFYFPFDYVLFFLSFLYSYSLFASLFFTFPNSPLMLSARILSARTLNSFPFVMRIFLLKQQGKVTTTLN